MEKETLEEAAEKYNEQFIEGAKLQKEMYSEQDVLRIIKECKHYLSFGDEFNEVEWFEQFKWK